MLHLEPTLQQRASQLVFAGFETDVELLRRSREFALDVGGLSRALLAFVFQQTNAVLAQGEFVFHLAYRLLQQHVGFFEPIESPRADPR